MWHNNEVGGVLTIDLSPLYQDFNEGIAHEDYFRWRRQGEGQLANYKQTATLTGVKQESQKTIWSNGGNPIDITGRPSLHRILLMRDITKRLRDLDDDAIEIDKKLFSKNSSVEIYFKLDGVEFYLGLNPTPNQPGNAVLTMTGTECGEFRDTHKTIEEFECFGKLGAKTIDSIVTRARRRGQRIREKDMDSSEIGDDIKKRMAEQLNFFMLTYDFEIARRLQRPFVNDSGQYDSLPVGILIAFNHLINRKRGNHYRWLFFTCLFLSKPTSRKQFLDEIIREFNKWDDDDGAQKWTHLDLIRLLDEHFGAETPFSP